MIYFIGKEKHKDFETCTLEYAVDYCESKSILGVDTETTRNIPKNKFNEKIYKAGLDPFMSKIILFQIGDLENQFVIDCRYNSIDCFKEILESKKILKVLHNAKFDAKMLLHIGIKLDNVWDTMNCDRILWNGFNYSFSLENTAKRYNFLEDKKNKDLFDSNVEEEDFEDFNEFDLMDGKDLPIQIDKTIRTTFVEWGNKDFEFKHIDYAVKDIILVLKVYNIQVQGRIVDSTLWNPIKAFRIENAISIGLAKMEIEGMYLNIEGWKDMYQENKIKYENQKKYLDQHIIEYFPNFSNKLDLFTNESTCTIMWTSSDQVIKLFKSLKICPKERSKSTGNIEYTVGAKSLFKLLTNENKDKFYRSENLEFKGKEDYQALILNYLNFKKYQMFTTTFGIDFLKYIHPITNKIHCSFKQFMNTGRMSCVAPNLQNQPNGKAWRKLYVCNKNEKFIAIDFKSQELRYLSVLANVEIMKDFFIKEHPIFKEDFHSFSATQLFRIIRKEPNLVIQKETHSKERTISKSLTFGINYGKGAYSVGQELGISEDEAQGFIDGFLDGFPGLRENFETRKKDAIKKGWIQISPYSDKRYFYPYFEEMNKLYKEGMSFYPENWKSMSKQQKDNFKQQIRVENPRYSEVWRDYMIHKGKLERRALNYPIQGGCSDLGKIALLYMLKENLNVVNYIHDEYCIYADIDKVEEVSKIANEAMIKAGKFFSDDVLFDGEAAVGDYWIH